MLISLQVDGAMTSQQVAAAKAAYVETATLGSTTEPLLAGWTSRTSFTYPASSFLPSFPHLIQQSADRFLPSSSPFPGGCYSEGTSGRALQGYSFTNTTSMTPNLCLAACAAKGYTYAGTEWHQECYCDNSLKAGASNAGSPVCADRCTGNANMICGGTDWNRVLLGLSRGCMMMRLTLPFDYIFQARVLC